MLPVDWQGIDTAKTKTASTCDAVLKALQRSASNMAGVVG